MYAARGGCRPVRLGVQAELLWGSGDSDRVGGLFPISLETGSIKTSKSANRECLRQNFSGPRMMMLPLSGEHWEQTSFSRCEKKQQMVAKEA